MGKLPTLIAGFVFAAAVLNADTWLGRWLLLTFVVMLFSGLGFMVFGAIAGVFGRLFRR